MRSVLVLAVLFVVPADAHSRALAAAPNLARPSLTVHQRQTSGPKDQEQDHSTYTDTDDVPTASQAELRGRAQQTDDLGWLPARAALGWLVPEARPNRSSLLSAKQAAIVDNDPARQARANALLASEAFTRTSVIVRHWLDQRDQRTGLMTITRTEEGTAGWYYMDTSADLYPHIAIGTNFLFPDRLPEVLAVLAAERRLAPAAPALPDDLLLPDGRTAGRTLDYRMFGAAEYAKDGLLPLVERLGREPWLGRLREVCDAILAASATPTPRGAIPASTNEVNGDVLQALTRAYWATGDERYFAAADRIGRAYVEDMLPKTGWLPVHDWDFVDEQPIGRRRLRLSDHGNEIVAGLVGWHFIESTRSAADAPLHRVAIRKMLDRMLDKGRNADGLWYRVIEIPSGKVEQEGLSDNWGYLTQAFLTQAAIERATPDGDPRRADSYVESAHQVLRALPKNAYYPWQRGQMDGYADSIESALYLLSRIKDDAAARWVDEQVGVLYGFQTPDGTEGDDYLDGNFVRTALLYAFSLTHGVWLDPWRPDVLVGAANDGACIEIAAAADGDWVGVLRFDTPRHRDFFRLPIDYPRLNEWPEGFVVESGHSYAVSEPAGTARIVDGGVLATGLPLHLERGLVRSLRVCPAA